MTQAFVQPEFLSGLPASGSAAAEAGEDSIPRAVSAGVRASNGARRALRWEKTRGSF